MIEAKLLALLLAYPPWYEDREEVGREDRMKSIAISLTEASIKATCNDGVEPDCERSWPGTTWELVTLAADLGWHESRYARHVHAGQCRLHIGECDAARVYGTNKFVALATSPWQLQRSGIVPYHVWTTLAGLDHASTLRAAHAAVRVVVHSRTSCAKVEPWPEATIARYATGRRCSWRGSAKRAAQWRRVRDQFQDWTG